MKFERHEHRIFLSPLPQIPYWFGGMFVSFAVWVQHCVFYVLTFSVPAHTYRNAWWIFLVYTLRVSQNFFVKFANIKSYVRVNDNTKVFSINSTDYEMVRLQLFLRCVNRLVGPKASPFNATNMYLFASQCLFINYLFVHFMIGASMHICTAYIKHL